MGWTADIKGREYSIYARVYTERSTYWALSPIEWCQTSISFDGVRTNCTWSNTVSRITIVGDCEVVNRPL